MASPSERGRNYTPLREVVHCALPEASCGQQMISVDFQSAPIITGEVTLPLRWLTPATPLWTCRPELSCVASCFHLTSLLKFGYTFFMRYKEALNHDFDEPKQWEIREINEIMNQCITGWNYFSKHRYCNRYHRHTISSSVTPLCAIAELYGICSSFIHPARTGAMPEAADALE